ncbi:MAG: hypothetical protein J6C53_01280 [Clostridia bacterium]|nr:hypothetical protein [Clostridia bacterium]
MQKVLFIFQFILKTSLIFAIAFIWLRFYLNSLWLAIGISVAITLVVLWILGAINKKRGVKANLKIKEKEEAENMFLSLLTDESPLSFFLNLAKSRHKNSKMIDDMILIEEEENENTILVPFIRLSPLSPDDINQILKKCSSFSASKIVITCNEYDKVCNSFIKNFTKDIVLIDKFETYALLYKEYDFYPEITQQYKKPKKLTFKDILASAFNRSKTKSYLFCAMVFLVSSLWIKMNVYYCIMSSLLLLFALISFINPKYNKKKERKIL